MSSEAAELRGRRAPGRRRRAGRPATRRSPAGNRSSWPAAPPLGLKHAAEEGGGRRCRCQAARDQGGGGGAARRWRSWRRAPAKARRPGSRHAHNSVAGGRGEGGAAGLRPGRPGRPWEEDGSGCRRRPGACPATARIVWSSVRRRSSRGRAPRAAGRRHWRTRAPVSSRAPARAPPWPLSGHAQAILPPRRLSAGHAARRGCPASCWPRRRRRVLMPPRAIASPPRSTSAAARRSPGRPAPLCRGSWSSAAVVGGDAG